jgi:SAM-dependent methyltransferase
VDDDRALQAYLDAVLAERVYSSKGNLRFNMAAVFHGVDLRGKRVLDIGGGDGKHSFYAACRGAAEVVCVDPEAEGSTSGSNDAFSRVQRRLKYDNVRLVHARLQDVENPGMFDVILMNDSINHIDEAACIDLLRNDTSRRIYKGVFADLVLLARPGSQLIICDCSRHNFFAALKLRNPFAPTIEWQKHQAPEVWAEILSEVGFRNPKISWTSFNPFRRVGRLLLANRLMAYFFKSHFRLVMERA